MAVNASSGGLDAAEFISLLKSLRSKLGTGEGVAKGRDGEPEVVLRSDQHDAVVAALRGAGYQAMASD